MNEDSRGQIEKAIHHISDAVDCLYWVEKPYMTEQITGLVDLMEELQETIKPTDA